MNRAASLRYCCRWIIGESPIRSGLTPIKASIMVHAIHSARIRRVHSIYSPWKLIGAHCPVYSMRSWSSPAFTRKMGQGEFLTITLGEHHQSSLPNMNTKLCQMNSTIFNSNLPWILWLSGRQCKQSFLKLWFQNTDSAIYQIDHPKKHFFFKSRIKRILDFRSISNQLDNLIFQGGVILDQF